jgi:hypothetical protein
MLSVISKEAAERREGKMAAMLATDLLLNYGIVVDARSVDGIVAALRRAQRRADVPVDRYELIRERGLALGIGRLEPSGALIRQGEDIGPAIISYAKNVGLESEGTSPRGLVRALQKHGRYVRSVGDAVRAFKRLLAGKSPSLPKSGWSSRRRRSWQTSLTAKDRAGDEAPTYREGRGKDQRAMPSAVDFRFAVRKIDWGSEASEGAAELTPQALALRSYGFALLGAGYAIDLGMPKEGDVAFAFRHRETGMTAVGCLPAVADLTVARAQITASIWKAKRRVFHRSAYRTQIDFQMRELARGMNPYAFEVARLLEEFGRFGIRPSELSGGLLFFPGEAVAEERGDLPEPAALMREALQGEGVAHVIARAPSGGVGHPLPLSYEPKARALKVGSATAVRLGAPGLPSPSAAALAGGALYAAPSPVIGLALPVAARRF